MSQAIVDPLELRRFAHHLKQFNGDLRERLSGLHAEMTRLSDSWRDQEHEKFTQEFEQTLRVVEHFLEISDQHVPFLQRKAERTETSIKASGRDLVPVKESVVEEELAVGALGGTQGERKTAGDEKNIHAHLAMQPVFPAEHAAAVIDEDQKQCPAFQLVDDGETGAGGDDGGVAQVDF